VNFNFNFNLWISIFIDPFICWYYRFARG